MTKVRSVRGTAALVGSAAVLAAAATAAGTAAAAPTAVPNSCFYGFDSFWRDQDISFDGTPAPAAVPPGSGSLLTQSVVQATLPTWIPQYGYNLGLFTAGLNEVPATVWVALQGVGSAEGVQVRKLEVTAATTITADAGGQFVSGTPVSVSVPIPDTVWSAAKAGTVALRQAGAGALPAVPGPSGAPTTPKGSLFIEARLANNVRFQLDCQPGSSGSGGSTMTPAAAPAFATVAIDPDAPPSGIASPAAKTVTLPPGVLRLSGRKVRVPVTCAAAVPCTGVVRLRSAARVKVGRTRDIQTLGQARFRVAAGAKGAATITLTARGRAVMKDRRALAVRVTAAPAAGPLAARAATLRRR
ncbi:MAG: hypothetical protein AB7V42_15800 [Thermoleophilia bacterium]